MTYVDGVISAVPAANKQAFIAFTAKMSPLFMANGALSVMDNWGDDVPDGKVTDLKRAVQAQPDEVVVFSWIVWPDKAVRDAAWAKIMQDESMHAADMPYDGKRMIFGGFETVFSA